MRRRGEKEKGSIEARSIAAVVLCFFLFAIAADAQETAPTPDPAKECAELQKTIDGYTEETGRIKLTLSFQGNSGYWQGAATELSFGIARRRIIGDLQAIAYKLGVRRLKDWSLVPLEDRLAYQKKVLQVLESERGKSILIDRVQLENRVADIEALLKENNRKSRDLGCADIPKEAAAPPDQHPR